MLSQRIRFCKTGDGVQIAYAVTGSGPALVRAPHWLTHIEYDWKMPVRRHWLEELSATYSYVRFDPRGTGLSDRDPPELSLESWVSDLETVVDATGLERFALLGPSQGASVAMTYAVRHPERVSHLVLFGAFARGRLRRGSAAAEDAETQLKLVQLGWGKDDPAYREFFASQIMPTASADGIASLTEMMRRSATPELAARLIRMFYEIDVAETARRVRCPTLLFHSRGDRRVPYEEGRLLAGLIPGARLVTLESINHMLPADDPAWPLFVAELRAFVPGAGAGSICGLSERESEVLEQLARGLDNAAIAARLGLSEKTVRNHLTRIFDKMDVQRRGEAIVRAREAGYGSA